MIMAWSKYKEIISGVTLLVFGLGYFYSATTIKTLSKSMINAQFFPKVLGVVFIILSVYQIVDSILKMSKKSSSSGDSKETEKLGKFGFISVLATLLALTIYIALLRPVGFLIMTIIYIFVQILILAPKNKRNIMLAIILSIVFSGIVYAIFVYGFTLMLPRGILNF